MYVRACVCVCVRVTTSLQAYNVNTVVVYPHMHARLWCILYYYVASICMHICVYVRSLVHIFHCTYIRTKYCVHVQCVDMYVHVHHVLLLPRGLLLTYCSVCQQRRGRHSGHVCTIVQAETKFITQKDLRRFLRAFHMKCLLDGTRLGVRTSYAEPMRCLLSTDAPQAPVAGTSSENGYRIWVQQQLLCSKLKGKV